jgi:hypothetical protein
MPGDLSIKITPSYGHADFIDNSFDNCFANFSQRTAHPNSCRESVTASAHFGAYTVHVDPGIFRPHTDSYFAFLQFFKKKGDDHCIDGSHEID